jgi:pimeloyl-ACP methyl ester carboxylesterase
MQEKEVRLKGKRLFYRTAGEGPAVVLLHGFGEDGTIWKNQFNAFPEYKLIIPDLPGSGKSDMIEDMSMEGLAEAIQQLIVHEQATLFYKEGEPDSVTMVGHSMGGYITLAFVEKYHHMLNGFGLFHSTAYADSEEKKETRKKGISFIEQHGPFEFLKTTIPNLYSSSTKDQNPAIIQQHINSARNFSGAALVSYYVSMMQRTDRSQLLNKTHLPVLFIMGRYDTAVPLEDGLKQCHLPNRSYVHILENSGHMGMIEELEMSNLILNQYLRATSNKLPS